MSRAPARSSGSAAEATERPASDAYGAAARHAPSRSLGRATPAGAFYAAQRRYLTGERIDMQALAVELDVSRPTLYRWTGGREQLLADVLFSLSDELFLKVRARTERLHGPERLMAVFHQYVGALVSARPLQAFLQQETQLALRILTSRDSSVQIRTVARLAELYREEQGAGNFDPGVDPETLAFAVVRITEAFIYHDAIIEADAEVERAGAIVALLLGVTH